MFDEMQPEMPSELIAPSKSPTQGPFRRVLTTVEHWYSQLGTLAKTAAAVSAIIGACSAVAGAYSAIHTALVRQETIASLVREARGDFQERDFAQSWDVDAKALQIAPTNRPALSLQAEIAMGWLEDGNLNSMQGAANFTDFANKLIQPLAREASSPSVQGIELADLKAHIGWARFLRSRDGITGLRIAGEFEDALKVDPTNMYAHVMAGFFTLWDGGDLATARPDFDAAMKSPRNPSFRDGLIMSALFNSHSEENAFAALDYANQIRKAGRTISPRQRDDVFLVYEEGLQDRDYLNRLSEALSPDDNIATLDWAMAGQTAQARRWNGMVIKAFLLEKQGRRADALALYENVIAEIPPRQSGWALDMARSQSTHLLQK